MSITISRSHNDNLTIVQMGSNLVWFSYETPVAFSTPETGRVVCENRWSTTTGRHLSAIDSGSSSKEGRAIVAARTPRSEFLELLYKHIG